jgi:hypothetical protein
VRVTDAQSLLSPPQTAIESGGFDGQGGAGLPAKLPPAATKSC